MRQTNRMAMPIVMIMDTVTIMRIIMAMVATTIIMVMSTGMVIATTTAIIMAVRSITTMGKGRPASLCRG